MPSKLSKRRAGRGRGPLRTLALGLTLALGAVAQPAKAQIAFEAGVSKFPTPTWGTNQNPVEPKKSGLVWDMVENNGIAYIGGEFSSIAPSVQLAGAVGVADGQPSSGFPTISGGVVNVSVPDGSGGWFVGGDFTKLNSIAMTGLAHILADGSIDTGWDASLAGLAAQQQFGGTHYRVWALARMGSYLYVGGEFARFGQKKDPSTGQVIAQGATRLHIARISAFTGTVDPNWNPGADNVVRGLAPSPDGQRVYVAGDFGTVAGQGRNGLAAVNDGGFVEGWAPSFPGADAIVVSSDSGRIYTGGNNGIAGFDTAGNALWPAVGGGAVKSVALSRSNATLYAGGDFTSLGGADRKYLGAVNALTGELDRAWAPQATKASSCTGVAAVSGVAVSEDGQRVFVGGCFSKVRDRDRSYLAAVDAQTGTLEPWNPGATGSVTSLSVSGTQVYAGGNFTSLGASARAMLAAIDMSTGRATDWAPQLQNDPGTVPVVQAMALSADKTKIFIAGNFSAVLGPDNQWLARDHLALVDLNTGLGVPGFNAGAFQGTVRSLLLHGGKLYVGGDFNSIRVSGTEQPGSRRDRPCPPGHSDCTPLGNKGDSAEWSRKGLMAALDPDTGELDLEFGLYTDASPGVGLIGQSGKQCSGTACGDGAVRALGVSGDGRYLYAGGTFSDMNGQLGLIALSLPGGKPTAWQPKINIPAFDVDVFKGDGKSLFVAGGGAGGSIDRFLPHEGPTKPVWHHQYDGDSVAVDSSLTTVYNGGHYDFVDNGTFKRKHASAFNVNGEIAGNFDPELDTTTGPFMVKVTPNHVVYGGEFSRVNRVPQPGYAQFPGKP